MNGRLGGAAMALLAACLLGLASPRHAVAGTNRWTSHWAEYNTDVEALAIDPFDTQTIYAGAFYTDEPPSADFYKSTDGGTSWTSVSQGLGDRGVQSIAMDPETPNTLYVGTVSTGV